MASLWLALVIVSAGVALTTLWGLHRQRRLLLGDPHRRRYFVQSSVTPAPRARRVSAPPGTTRAGASPAGATVRDTTAPPGSDEGVLYVDAAGHCTLANQAARALLHWMDGDLSLSDVLAGGRREVVELLQTLERRGQVEQHTTALAGPAPTPLEISAVALRDRDDNLWGAALLIHPARLAHSAPASLSGPSRH